MTSTDRWLLPQGVDDVLPEEAAKLEFLRRQLLDLYASWGYQMVNTPLIEFLDSLLIRTSRDLELHTFKITDQLSGRMMGIRADITPQVARIDAHCLNRQGPVRLCYADSVLHTKPIGLLNSRVPFRVGAELFGYSGVECDIELICLMYQSLVEAGIADIHIVLGHVGIFRTLIDVAQVNKEDEQAIFQTLQRKAYAEVDALLKRTVKDLALRKMVSSLSRMSGGKEVLKQAVSEFRNAPASVRREIKELETIAKGVQERIPTAELCFDLCELRGYEYHTGIVFAAYMPQYGRAVAKGGRYDDIGKVFGRARPASGFDCDLKTLVNLSSKTHKPKPGIIAPAESTPELMESITALRKKGEVVIANLGGKQLSKSELLELNCNRRLVRKGKSWVVEKI
jgi:ATP phosphoribosyltransferase regulatory subunit